MARSKKRNQSKVIKPKKKSTFKRGSLNTAGGSKTRRSRKRSNLSVAAVLSPKLQCTPNAMTTEPSPSFYIDTTPSSIKPSNVASESNGTAETVVNIGRKRKRRYRKSMALAQANKSIISVSSLNTTQETLVPAANSTEIVARTNVADNAANNLNYETPRVSRHSKKSKSAADKIRQKWRKYTKDRLKKSSPLAFVSPNKTAETKGTIFRLLGGESNDFGEFSSADEQDANLLQDLDLVILAASPADYEAYTKLLRQEYASLSEENYKKMRLKVLETLLMIPSIFTTPEYQTKYEAAARNNIKWEINILKTQGN